VDGGAFAQEFGVGGHVELGVGPGGADHFLHLAVGAHRHGGFGDHHGVALHGAGYFFSGGHHIAEVGVAVAPAGGGAHGDEHGFGVFHRLGDVGGEGQAA